MRRELLCGVAAVALAGAAASQPAAAAEPWTGLYAGGHLGAGLSNWGGEWDPSEPVDFDDKLGTSGLVGGMQAGLNYQIPQTGGWASFVIGAELDLSAVGGMVEGGRFDGIFGPSDTLCGSSSHQCGSKVDWLMSLRARLGIAFDQTLVYGTVGPAFVAADAWVASDTTGEDFDFDSFGVAWGLGVDLMATPNLIVGAEWLRYDINDEQTITFSTSGTIELDNIDVIRFRLSYKF